MKENSTRSSCCTTSGLGLLDSTARAGPNEVLFKWDQRDVSLGGTKKHKRVDPPAGIDPVAIERKPKGGQRT